MIVDTANIPCAPYSRQSCIFWLAAANGGCYPRIFRNGSRSISFSASGERTGHIEHFIQKTIMRIRRKRGQNECPTVGALDAQSVKWGNRQSDNGFDANKSKGRQTQHRG